MRSVLLATSVLGALLGCQTRPPGACQGDADCAPREICLDTAVCAMACSTNMGCSDLEKCSAVGGCIPQGECGSDLDCAKDEVCSATSKKCGASGAPAGDEKCVAEWFPATLTPAKVMVLLDRSGSMRSTLPSGLSRWDTATAAVKAVTSAHEATVRFGLTVFPELDTQCAPGSVLLAPAVNNAAAISNALPAFPGTNTPASFAARTPLGAALQQVSTRTELTSPTFANYVLLLADGGESCGGDPLAQTKALFALHIKTWVVGFADEVDSQALSEMAKAAGTARAGAISYYQADDSATLVSALRQIAQGAAGCDFTLERPLPEPSKLYVYVNGTLTPRDPSKQNGWDVGPTSSRVILYGAACQALTQNPKGQVSLVYGCPDDTLSEGGGNGGNLPDGVTIN